jgi:hypothetical protein
MNVSLFVALYTLFNFYLYFIAFLYQPCSEGVNRKYGGPKGDSKEAMDTDRERQHIMNEFYQTELNDMNDTLEEDPEIGNYSPVKQESAEKTKDSSRRRDLKKAPEEKAKERLWETLVKEAEDKEGESDSDDDKI